MQLCMAMYIGSHINLIKAFDLDFHVVTVNAANFYVDIPTTMPTKVWSHSL